MSRPRFDRRLACVYYVASLRAQRSNLLPSRGLLRRFAPRNDQQQPFWEQQHSTVRLPGVTVRDIIKLLEADGWYVVAIKGSHPGIANASQVKGPFLRKRAFR